MKKLKIYTLFPKASKFSCKTEDYHGSEVHVMAVSLKQAMYKAYQHEWADSPRDVGIVEIYEKHNNFMHRDWRGVTTYGQGGLADHGMSPAQLERRLALNEQEAA
ncbi:hypothetical protein [Glutamicibacter sp. AOP33-2CA-4]|uniref:hypothetical protein n=1 Tax=Glutamicibacter sp. AOP33-2CA-4 TaxID=3457690 RepID=UPI0040348260